MDILQEGKLRGKNIADVVKEQVHGTSVGKGSTVVWIERVLTELRLHVAIPVDSVDWSEESIGTLLSAAGMTVRYVTEAPTCAAYIAEFESIFLHVLEVPKWTKPFVGLKMVALRGCTRLLESFADVVQRHAEVIDWISTALDIMLSTDDASVSTCMQLLFRPTCEHLNVLVQAHAASVPLLMPIVPRFLRLYSTKFCGCPTKQNKDDILEFTSFLSVLLDTILPPLPSARSLLATPLLPVEASPLLPLHVMSKDEWHRFYTSSAAMKSMLCVLPSLYAAASYDLPCEASTDCFVAYFLHILTMLGEAATSEGSTIDKLEHMSSAVESLRDLLMRHMQFQPKREINDVAAPFMKVVPVLQDVFAFIGDVAKDKSLRGFKAIIADIRDSGIECYVALMHVMGTDFWSLETEFSFLHTVAVKVADPLIFGDFLKVLRPVDRNNVDQVDRYASKVADVVTVLTKGLRQSQRYSKTLAVRMVEGVSQIAVGAGVDLKPHVPRDCSRPHPPLLHRAIR
ncbi:hypothetical protein, variant [Aphanomyces invadans]|uniref:Uncharacterized protein n=1 Tax=Aphanomyces invadans TaxID=157072 RepID=A0A024UFC7_9STRA|nr:hypothetical protein, variant [Aphanomyces invadans]ETW04338.1 hypothetical protein, variant [Aphanomyces invadans]|eukprot:XP_008867294.1 hypothetical protein, variant [Aphanomyces invadans]